VRDEELRGAAQRNWARVERAKLAFGTRPKAEDGSAPEISEVDLQRLHALVRARAPKSVQRWVDLAHHIRLKRRIDAESARLRPVPEGTTGRPGRAR